MAPRRRAQAYANAGDSLPVVFCKRRGDNTGGVWISPLLVDANEDFERTFVYLIGKAIAAGIATTMMYW